MNLESTIIPKSDQLNADDLITGPRTITITDVTKGSAEQPVVIHFDGEDGRPYKPGKSMRRILVAMWGVESKTYIGRRLTIFRDPNVRFGGQDVGGIRISHASDIGEPYSIALTEIRSNHQAISRARDDGWNSRVIEEGRIARARRDRRGRFVPAKTTKLNLALERYNHKRS